tara:strand:- start:771 stop:980 length:210 start_codon:yes stop_codon:yes gene_type:complete
LAIINHLFLNAFYGRFSASLSATSQHKITTTHTRESYQNAACNRHKGINDGVKFYIIEDLLRSFLYLNN